METLESNPQENAEPTSDIHRVEWISGAPVWARRNKKRKAFFLGTIASSQANGSNATKLVQWGDGSQSTVDESDILVRIPNSKKEERDSLADENAVHLSNRIAQSLRSQQRIPPPR